MQILMILAEGIGIKSFILRKRIILAGGRLYPITTFINVSWNKRYIDNLRRYR